jgi:hypothetical protein
MLSSFLTQRYKWKSRWSLLFFHVTVRVASQAFGIAFGILGFSNTSVFLAYLILGAEGYFTLVSRYIFLLKQTSTNRDKRQVLSTFRFLISWHQHNLPSHESWLEPRRDKSKKMTLASSLQARPSPMGIMHFILLLANTAIIFGGAQLAGATDLNDPGTIRQLHLSNVLRTVGQSVFLACNVGLLVTIVGTMVGRKMHPTLVLLLVIWFPLIIRGTFGVLQAAVYDVSVFSIVPCRSLTYTPM